MPEKKAWGLPQLIVLTRGGPEENVLAYCKSHNPSSGAGSKKNQCHNTEQPWFCGNDCLRMHSS